MRRKIYIVIIIVLILNILCSVGTSAWIITNTVYFKPKWYAYNEGGNGNDNDDKDDEKYKITYVNNTYINENLSHFFGRGELHTDKVSDTDNYQIWMPDSLTKESINNDSKFSHDFHGWYLSDGTEITSFDQIKEIGDGKETKVTIVLTAMWRTKIFVSISDKYVKINSAGIDENHEFIYTGYHHNDIPGEVIDIKEYGYIDTDDDPDVPTSVTHWLINDDERIFLYIPDDYVFDLFGEEEIDNKITYVAVRALKI